MILKYISLQNSIVHLLSPREIEIARRLFRVYDNGCQGTNTEFDAKKAIAAYYTLFIECDDTLNGWVCEKVFCITRTITLSGLVVLDIDVQR